jgi:hypothetical protein
MTPLDFMDRRRRWGFGERRYGTEIQKIPEPLFMVRTPSRRNGSFFENGVKPRQNGDRNGQHCASIVYGSIHKS